MNENIKATKEKNWNNLLRGVSLILFNCNNDDFLKEFSILLLKYPFFKPGLSRKEAQNK